MKLWRLGACLVIALCLAGGLSACDNEPADPGRDSGTPEEDAGPTGGPIDGTWSLTATTCDGAEVPYPPYTLTIDDASGTFVLTLGAECSVTWQESYTYSGSSITITPNSVMCDTVEACGMIPMGPSCDMLPPPITFEFALSGSELTFTRPAGGPDVGDPCPAGGTIVHTMSLLTR